MSGGQATPTHIHLLESEAMFLSSGFHRLRSTSQPGRGLETLRCAVRRWRTVWRGPALISSDILAYSYIIIRRRPRLMRIGIMLKRVKPASVRYGSAPIAVYQTLAVRGPVLRPAASHSLLRWRDAALGRERDIVDCFPPQGHLASVQPKA
jgi:hypothetical protein